ncbi:MAG: lipoate protein ligase C-terminal domain-containing protein [Candidatus Jordarchaeales archaeon]
MGSSRLKVPGGKMIEAEVELEGGVIRRAKITGDFYFHPEEELEVLEEALRGVAIHAVEDVIKRFLSERGIVLVGINVEDIVKVVTDAAKK